ncbi:MAG: type II secretion system protein [Anaerovoracaceae bacterium]|jgi:prepilin-type N-terminal cleavage/methylation domain-containing protein
MKQVTKNNAGLTIVELMVSIALIGIILAGFLPLFVMSANTNQRSETTLDSTYMGKDGMEFIYHLSREFPYEDLTEAILEQFSEEKMPHATLVNYSGHASIKKIEYEYRDDKSMNIELKPEGNLIRVEVKVYDDSSMNTVKAQYESLYSWTGRGY